MYKSLYRKYRPHDFESVYGQDHIIRILENSIKNDKVAHAYLFTGTRGTGKTTTAKIFARMINCLNMKNGEPCGECLICKNENTDEIPDIIEIDAASNNGVDEIRDLKSKIKLVPTMCKYKVYIIDEVHMLSIGAFNALLKTLEEPPEHVVFILATTDPQKIPITVISRCQRFDFKKISVLDIKRRLEFIAKKEEINIDDAALNEISKLSDGALRDSIGLLELLNSYNAEHITLDDVYIINGNISISDQFKLVDYYINNDYEHIINFIDEYYFNGKNFQLLMNDILEIFENVMLYKRASKYFYDKQYTYLEEIKKLSEKISDSDVDIIINNLEDTIKIMRDSTNQRILAELFLLKKFNNENICSNEEQIVNEDYASTSKKAHEKSKTFDKYELKKPIINNTLMYANANDKKYFTSLISTLLTSSDLVNKITNYQILKDCTVVAASKDHAILCFPYVGLVDEFDLILEKVVKLLFENSNIKYKIVSIEKDKWDEIRPQYLELVKNKKIIEMDENFDEPVLETDFQSIIEEE